MRYLLLLFTATLLATPLYAEETTSSDEELQPEVTIVHRGKEIIEEYRVGGQLYMIKITPSNGVPYYLMDTDGDGSLETRRNDLENPSVVQWRIFTW
jgi:hypothetical protein